MAGVEKILEFFKKFQKGKMLGKVEKPQNINYSEYTHCVLLQLAAWVGPRPNISEQLIVLQIG